MQKQFTKPRIVHWSKTSRGSASATKIYVRREKGEGGGRGETARKNPASWLSMINKPVKERVHCGEREGRSDYVAKNNLPPQNASGREEARKHENSASTHNDPSEHRGEPTDEELLSNASCQLAICQILFVSNHLQTVAWPESALSFSGVKLELGCRSSLGAGVCEVGLCLSSWSTEK